MNEKVNTDQIEEGLKQLVSAIREEFPEGLSAEEWAEQLQIFMEGGEGV